MTVSDPVPIITIHLHNSEIKLAVSHLVLEATPFKKSNDVLQFPP
jgi:hypothetical protein